MKNLGEIEETNYSDWVAMIVAVSKLNGVVCICGDYKVTVNPVLQVDSTMCQKHLGTHSPESGLSQREDLR